MASVVPATVELYGMQSCPYTTEMREHLLWNGIAFTEFDVEIDVDARARLLALTGHPATAVPVLVEDGCIKEIGWRGRSCVCR